MQRYGAYLVIRYIEGVWYFPRVGFFTLQFALKRGPYIWIA